MIAYKFLRPGAVGVFSRFAWPAPEGGRPGAWVDAQILDPCRSGIHACRTQDLPFWVAPELWRIELEPSSLIEQRRKVVASRGRLVQRIEEWDDGCRAAYIDMCAARMRECAADVPQLAGWVKVVEPSRPDGPALMGFMAARLAEAANGPQGYVTEREYQSRWLTERLGLD